MLELGEVCKGMFSHQVNWFCPSAWDIYDGILPINGCMTCNYKIYPRLQGTIPLWFLLIWHRIGIFHYFGLLDQLNLCNLKCHWCHLHYHWGHHHSLCTAFLVTWLIPIILYMVHIWTDIPIYTCHKLCVYSIYMPLVAILVSSTNMTK